MNGWEEKLSAYLDDELPEAEATAIAALIDSEPEVAAAFEALCATQVRVSGVFGQMLDEPVPFALAKAVQSAPEPVHSRRGWWLAACVAFAMIGATAGFFMGQRSGFQPVQVVSDEWLVEIAAYHSVYAQQKSHLVEVPAARKDHIETWLTASVGVQVRVPDLSAEGLTFEGARLLVVAGSPVAQLVFTDARGAVLALCLKAAKAPTDKSFAATRMNGQDLVSWRRGGTDFVVVGPEGGADIGALARAADQQV